MPKITKRQLKRLIAEEIAVQEAVKLNIPVVAVIDSNSNPDGITYPIPGNDDALRAIHLYLELFSASVLDGLQQEISNTDNDIGSLENPQIEKLPENIVEQTESEKVDSSGENSE